MGFQTPSKIQEIALPNLINNPPSMFNLSAKYYYLIFFSRKSNSSIPIRYR